MADEGDQEVYCPGPGYVVGGPGLGETEILKFLCK